MYAKDALTRDPHRYFSDPLHDAKYTHTVPQISGAIILSSSLIWVLSCDLIMGPACKCPLLAEIQGSPDMETINIGESGL